MSVPKKIFKIILNSVSHLNQSIGILMIYSIFLYNYSFTHEGSSGTKIENENSFLDDHIVLVVVMIMGLLRGLEWD